MKKLSFKEIGFYTKLDRYITDEEDSSKVSGIVAGILEDVKENGDRAVIEYTERFDGFRTSAAKLKVDPAELKAGEASLLPVQRKGIREAIRCVREFHKIGLPKSWKGKNPHGATVGERWYPIDRVGVYVPAGLVSTVVMTTVLARLAGVSSVAVFTPAGKDGRINPQMLGGLSLCGITEVYRIGGAQAIAAMAYGTKSIPPVNKIVGPGNAFVVEAQRQVFGAVGIDLIPGPSEALVIADESADPKYIAADLLAQAEHGSGRERLYFVYRRAALANRVEKEALSIIDSFGHAEAIRHIWKSRCCFIQVPDSRAAIEVANYIAPEHLELHVAKNSYSSYISGINTAGAILCGHETPTVIGDFTAGPSHTLPTSRTGRFFSGLKITDFMRRSSIVEYDRTSLERAREVVRIFAELEDLDAHGNSCEVRFNLPE